MSGGAELAKKLEWRIWRGGVIANLTTAAMLIITSTQMEPFIRTTTPFNHLILRTLAAGGIYVAICLFVSRYVVRWRLGPVRAFLIEEREPTEAERLAALSQPTRQGLTSLGYWAALLIWTYLFNRHLIVWTPSFDAKVVVAVVGWGLYASAALYLLVETAMRPVLPLVLIEEPRAHGRLESLLTRSLLVGGLGSGWVLVLFLTLIVGSTATQRAHAFAGAVTALVVAVIASLVLTTVSARSVIRPLRGVQRAMRQVADGNLDVLVPIDDATEVGQLQAGFNDMLAGLRERETLRDLFGRHVGVDVAEEALGREIGMMAETRNATVMFVDVVSSTSLTQEHSAHEVLAMLNALFGAVVRVISGEGGSVNSFVGDAALCLFGAPKEQPDHAVRALRAARALRDEIDDVARTHPGFNAAIGLSSGDVVAGHLGSESRYEYTVIGDPVNEASRLTDAAKIYSCRLLAADSVIKAAPDEAEAWTYAGEFELRGRSQLTLAFVPK